MKIAALLISTFLFLNFSLATPPVTAPQKQKAAAPAAATPVENELLKGDVMKEIEVFSKKKLNAKKDQKEVEKMVNILLALDDEDPSRTGVIMLSESYNRYPAMYNKAFKAVENKKTKAQKEQLKEIKTIMKNFDKEGNG